MKWKFKLSVLAAAIGASVSAQGGELPSVETLSGLQFNFSPPGARSLGMGGAFIGRADDATAAYANPAGLTNLFSPEISAEYRSTDYMTDYTSGGTAPNVDRATAKSDTNNLAYLSYVHPKDNWVFSVYRQQVMDFNTAFDAGAVILSDNFFYFGTENFSDIDIVSYGFSVAYRLNDRLSLGANISYYDYSMNAGVTRFDTTAMPAAEVSSQFQNGSDKDYGINVGALFRATDRLSIGLVYRSSAKFDTQHSSVLASGTTEYMRNFNFETPDMYGIGFSFQPNDSLTLNLDINRVNYSNISNPVFWAFADDAGPDIPRVLNKINIDDGTEIRLGGEYVFSNAPVALRAGVWRDPAHTLEHMGGVTESEGLAGLLDEAYDAIFQGSDDETHLAVGVGVFWDRFQLDFAADFSDIQDTYSVSGVFRF